jgi:aryl-alcohol dehydrogenase-like predicted oxidoreductase
VELLRSIAATHGASVAQVALAWLLAREAVTSVLIGASKIAQLEDNLGAATLSLSAKDIAELDAVTPLPPVYPHWYSERFGDAPALKAVERL